MFQCNCSSVRLYGFSSPSSSLSCFPAPHLPASAPSQPTSSAEVDNTHWRCDPRDTWSSGETEGANTSPEAWRGKTGWRLDMVTHACNPSILGGEAGGWLWVPGQTGLWSEFPDQPGLHYEALSEKKKTQRRIRDWDFVPIDCLLTKIMSSQVPWGLSGAVHGPCFCFSIS